MVAAREPVTLRILILSISFLFFSETRGNDDHYRLPNSSKPLHYRLTFAKLRFEPEFTFSGTATISIAIQETTNTLMLHSKSLKIKKVYFDGQSDLTFSLCNRHEILTVNLGEELPKSTTRRLNIEYEGVFRDDMSGFYRSWYQVGNVTRWIVCTQFEPTYARMAFPCFDEPRFRAPFTISVARSKNRVAISNMPVASSRVDSNDGGIVWDEFETTPPMATYLVAVAVLDFEAAAKKGKNVFWARPNAAKDTAYASDIAAKLFAKMEKFSKRPNIMPQTHFLAVPDFGAGAMENWGLITFRETLALYNAESCSEENLQRITTTIAHEISHYWFGNLVTPVWWNYLWLNEGFARYFQYYLTKELKPSWRNDQYYVVGSFQTALSSDIGQHPLNGNVTTPDEISHSFDKITYDKGAAVIRMLEHTISNSSTFRSSLRNYLRKGWVESGGSVTPELLWAAFDSQAKKDNIALPKSVPQLMESWTKNPSYPIINVRKTDSGCIQIEQKTYRSLRATKSIDEQKWIIPLTYTKRSKADFSSTKPTLWSFPGQELHLHDDVEIGEEWIIFNVQATGFYRANYDEENWNLIIDQLRSNPRVIHPVNRAQLIDDSISLATDKYLCYRVPIELLKYLDGETDVIPWFTAIEKLSHVYSLFELTRMGPLVRDYIHARLHRVYHRIGFAIKANDDHLTKVFRTSFLNFACRSNLAHCLEDATREYDKNKNKLTEIPADVKEAVLCAVHFNRRNASLWQDLWNVYKTSNVAYEKITILKSLGCTKDSQHLRKLLYKTIDESDTDVRNQDFSYVYLSCFSHPAGITAGLQLIRDLLQTISEGLGGPQLTPRIVDMIDWLKRGIRTKEQITQLEDLIGRAERLNTKPLKNVIEALNNAKKVAVKTQELIRVRSDSLEHALGGSGNAASRLGLVPSFATSFASLFAFWISLNRSFSPTFSLSL